METPLSPKPVKAFSYLRFSTPEQMHGDSLRRQSDLAAEFARRHGLELDDKLSFRDLGVSAFRSSNANVGKLGELREAVKVGLIPQGSLLLVESLDRISRDHAFDAQHLLSDIIRSGVNVATLIDGRIYSWEGLRADPMGMMYSILGFMRAHEESAVKSRRLSEAWEDKRAKAVTIPLTSIAPAWLSVDRAANKIAEVTERVSIVRRIFSMTLDGEGQHKIASTLNREGVTTWGKGKRQGTRWHASYIAKILANPAVIGTMTPHRIEFRDGIKRRIPLAPLDDYFPAVISREVWDEVQAIKAGSGAPRGRQATGNVHNILAQLAKCPKCGATVTRVQKGQAKKGGHPSLVCTVAKTGGDCEYKSVRYSTVENRLLQVLPGVVRDREGLEVVEDTETRITALEDAIHANRSGSMTLAQLLQDEPSPTLRAQLRSLEGALPEMEAQLALLREHRDILAGPIAGSRIERLIAALEPVEGAELNRKEANLALRALFKTVVINWPQGAIDLEWHLGGTCRVHYGPNIITLAENKAAVSSAV